MIKNANTFNKEITNSGITNSFTFSIFRIVSLFMLPFLYSIICALLPNIINEIVFPYFIVASILIYIIANPGSPHMFNKVEFCKIKAYYDFNYYHLKIVRVFNSTRLFMAFILILYVYNYIGFIDLYVPSSSYIGLAFEILLLLSMPTIIINFSDRKHDSVKSEIKIVDKLSFVIYFSVFIFISEIFDEIKSIDSLVVFSFQDIPEIIASTVYIGLAILSTILLSKGDSQYEK